MQICVFLDCIVRILTCNVCLTIQSFFLYPITALLASGLQGYTFCKQSEDQGYRDIYFVKWRKEKSKKGGRGIKKWGENTFLLQSKGSWLEYWLVHKLPQIHTANHATFPIQIRIITVQICGILWVTQYMNIWLSNTGTNSVVSLIFLLNLGRHNTVNT